MLRSASATPPRTLVDIFRPRCSLTPQATALDSGVGRAHLRRARRGRRRGRRRAGRARGRTPATRSACGSRRAPPTSTSPSSAILLAGAAYVPGRRRRPRRAGPAWSSTRPRSPRSSATTWPSSRAGERACRESPRAADARRRRLGHLHLRLDRHAQGRRGHPPQRRGVRRRRVADVPPGRAARPRRPGDGRPVGRLRRQLRGDVAGLGVRRLPGARAPRRWCAAASTSGRGWSPTTSPWSRPCRPWSRCGPTSALDRGAAADHGRRGLPARAGGAAAAPGPRGLEHLRPDRGDGRRLRRAARRHRPGADRAARSTAGTSRSSTPTATRWPRARPAS